jgi:hypothetical protein
MSKHEFENQLRNLLRRDPFVPFVIRTDAYPDIVVERPQAVALAAGGIGYIDSDQIFFVESNQVIEIRPVSS